MSEKESCRLRARVRGRVQGVFYRASCRKEARILGLSGWVRNSADGSVELEAQGPRHRLEKLLAWCRLGPPGARVDSLEFEWIEATGEEGDFVIKWSDGSD
jgi:acylphosphatase